MAERSFRFLRDLLDLDETGKTEGKVVAVAADDITYELVDQSGGGGAPSGPAGGVLGGTYPNPGFAADMATQAELDAHVNDAADAHDASAVSFAAAGGIVATDVQAAIAELDTEKLASSAGLLKNPAATQIYQPTAGDVILAIRAHAAQTADLKQWQLSNGSVRTAINATGELTLTQATQANAGTAKPLRLLAAGGREVAYLRWYDAVGYADEYSQMVLTGYNAGNPILQTEIHPGAFQIGEFSGNYWYSQADADGTRMYFYGRPSVGSGDWFGMYLDDQGAQPAWGIKNAGHEYLSALVAIADADVDTSQRVQWFDDAVGVPKLRFKQRDSAGTLTSGIAASEAFVLATKLDDLATPDDNTDLNASTTKHGLLRKLSNTATEYLDGTGAWSTPAGGSGIPATILDAKGDLIAATAADTAARLAVGTNGQVLTADSDETTGLKWSAAGSGAPVGAQYVVGAADGTLTNEIVASAFALTLLDDADAATARATLGAIPWSRKYKTGFYYLTNQEPAGDATMTPVLNRVQYHVFPVGEALTIDRITCGVSTAGTALSVVRLGIYNDTDGQPSTLLLDAGTVAGDSTGYKEITVSQALTAGTLYWIAVVWQIAPVGALRASGTGVGGPWVGQAAASTDPRTCTYNQDTVVGALPGTATPATATPTTIPASVKVRAV